MDSNSWNKKAEAALIGKTIRSVRYMTEEETHLFGWSKKPLIIDFTDNSYIIPMSDDEGNEAGSIQGYNGQNDSDMSFPTL